MKTQKAYKFRLYPTKAQIKIFEQTLNLCRELYNASLQERRDAYRRHSINLNYYDQANQLSAIKEVRPDVGQVHSQVLQDVLRRSDKAFKNFFRRVKQGVSPGYPRFQGRNRYDSFCYPQSGWSLHNDKLTLSKIGTLRLKLHRPVSGKVKTCTIKREGSQWFCVFSVEYEFEMPVHTGPTIGIDMGLENFANLSNGEQIANPRYFRRAQKRLVKVQRRYAKLKQLPRTNTCKAKTLKALQHCHRKVRNQRLDFLHKVSSNLTKRFSSIVVEDLSIKGLASGRLAKSFNDVGIGTFFSMLAYKVAKTGSKLLKVDPRYTSQICPNCGKLKKKELSERCHSCECGCEMQRDIAAALVILSRGLATIGVNP